jgi:large subunit ribosomal protein L21
MKYAIIETGGKQYKVQEGEKVKIEKVPGVEGQSIEFTRVLFVSGIGDPKVGAPLVESAKVAGEIVANARDKKILVFKKKRRKGYAKKFGHRQPFTEVLIKQISA